MKVKNIFSFIYCLIFAFFPVVANAQYTDSFIYGMGVYGLGGEVEPNAIAGVSYKYEIKYGSGSIMPTDKIDQIVWEVEGGIIKSYDTSSPAVNIQWNSGISSGKITARSVYEDDGAIERIAIVDITDVNIPTELTVNISSDYFLRGEQININVISNSTGVTLEEISFKGDGFILRSQSGTTAAGYFSSIGNKTIEVSAKVYKDGTSMGKTITGMRSVTIFTDKIKYTGDGYACYNKTNTLSIPELSINPRL